MADIVFIAHMPLLRMVGGEDFPIGGGVLTRVPWDQFDSLSQGAFSEWRHKYEAADPVFYWFQEAGDFAFVSDGEAQGLEELKLPTASWNSMLPPLGHELIERLHEHLVDPVWAAIALAAPAGVPAPPRDSLTFFMPAGEQIFTIAGRQMKGVRVQGDADHELAYLPDATGQPLGHDDLQRAASLVGLTRWSLSHKTLGPVLRQLMMCGDITLRPAERMLLAVTAAEDLLLPDVTTGSGDTFARRLSNLLGHDDAHRDTLRGIARSLYRARSAVIHAEEAPESSVDLPPAAAEQLLAGAIESAALAAHTGVDVERLREMLDAGPVEWQSPVRTPLPDPPGAGQPYRLGPRRPWFSGTFSPDMPFGSPEGTITSWSPIVGLAVERPMVHDGLGLELGMIQASALVSMEEKDIRRDFIARTQLAGPVAAIAVRAAGGGSPIDETQVAPLTRVRDLAVAGLRLAGYAGFVDPELAGWYVYDGHLRHRRETVLRQSIIMAIDGATSTTLTDARMTEVMDLWSLVARYDAQVRDPEIDRALDLYRRVHDRRFLPATTRGHLAWICVELLLGRFRSPTGTVRLETLVYALEDVPAATREWFMSEGRAFRNAVAHGDWQPEPLTPPGLWQADYEPLAHVLAVAGGALRALLQLWVSVDPPVRARYGPSRLLVRRLSRMVTS